MDLSALEDDGYIVRALGGETVIFARTEDGLDRGVRKFAKAFEAGEAAAIDVAYHEGYRVKRFTVGGADISTFAVRVEGPGRDEDVSGLRFRVEEIAASNVSPLIKKMCGAELASEADAEHFIIFRPTSEDGWREGDYRYAVENGDLVFEYAEFLGAKYALFTFLSDECGWDNISSGRDFLAEADEIAIPDELDVSVRPMFDGMRLHTLAYGLPSNNSARRDIPGFWQLYGTSYRIPHACNGWLTYGWGGYDVTNQQPCMSDAQVLGLVTGSILDYIEVSLDCGRIIGYDLNYIDVAHGDNGSFCRCAKCVRVYGEEGSVAGASMRFANAVYDLLESEGYGELKVIFYAYLGNREPCRTPPRENVYITYCTDFHCVTHPMDGSCCTEKTHLIENCGSADHTEYIRGWNELTDNLYLWHYDLDYNFHPFIYVEQIWDDAHLFSELGVKKIYWTTEYYGIGITELENQLIEWLDHHPSATKEEYNDRYRELVEKHFGGGWEKLLRAFELWEKAEMHSDRCCGGWLFGFTADVCQMDYRYYVEECFDEIVGLIDGAILEADSSYQVGQLEILKACHMYHFCLGAYFAAYETDDGELMSKVEDSYELMIGLFTKNGIDVHKQNTVSGTIGLSDDVHEQAWEDWNDTPFSSWGKYFNRKELLRQWGLYEEGDALRSPPAALN